MKIKKIYSRHYDGPWHSSSLDYEEEIRHFKRMFKHLKLSSNKLDELLIAFRNGAASVNSYKIIEVEIPNPPVCEMKFLMVDYRDSLYYLTEASRRFEDCYKLKPKVIHCNLKTFDTIRAHLINVQPMIHIKLDLKVKLDRFILRTETV